MLSVKKIRIRLIFVLSICALIFNSPLALAQFSGSGPIYPVKGPGPGNLPHVDEIAYCLQLFTARPDIVVGASPAATTTNPALNALVIGQPYRTFMLVSPHSYDLATVNACPSPSNIQVANDKWVANQQASQKAFKANLVNQYKSIYPRGTEAEFEAWLAPQNNIKPGYYPIDSFVSYYVGPKVSLYQPTTNLDCKLYLTFDNVTDSQKHLTPVMFSTVTPAVYYGFAQALFNAGFNGDFKSPAWGDALAMNYNQIIIHCGSIANAKLAEQVAEQYFYGTLAYESRGIDTLQGTQQTDWHQYLLENSGNISALPSNIQAWLTYQN